MCTSILYTLSLVPGVLHQGTWYLVPWYLVHGTGQLCHQLMLPLYPACKWGMRCRCSELQSRPKPANSAKLNCWGSREPSLLYACLLFEHADIIETLTILSKYCETLLINTPPHLVLLDPTARKQQCRSLIHGIRLNYEATWDIEEDIPRSMASCTSTHYASILPLLLFIFFIHSLPIVSS